LVRSPMQDISKGRDEMNGNPWFYTWELRVRLTTPARKTSYVKKPKMDVG
jgi:hypothetical protein